MRQQVVISGFGGQGVVFVTKLLAEVAVRRDLSVLASETHGMAQRGGNVVSHVKVFDRDAGDGFVSPLIRRGHADLMIALHPATVTSYRSLLREDGTIICNGAPGGNGFSRRRETIIFCDATAQANAMGIPVMANMVLLGFAASRGHLFCNADHIEEAIKMLGDNHVESAVRALRRGVALTRGEG